MNGCSKCIFITSKWQYLCLKCLKDTQFCNRPKDLTSFVSRNKAVATIDAGPNGGRSFIWQGHCCAQPRQLGHIDYGMLSRTIPVFLMCTASHLYRAAGAVVARCSPGYRLWWQIVTVTSPDCVNAFSLINVEDTGAVNTAVLLLVK